eukprot:Phypoly_transcript_28665.p1 GENE.Phypoly_transcript_28665~~Phypoly_transcript_28665.p1  ORF type:complete len:109 (+),score=5.97 Phypoly_transcript_28665:53-379(+)
MKAVILVVFLGLLAMASCTSYTMTCAGFTFTRSQICMYNQLVCGTVTTINGAMVECTSTTMTQAGQNYDVCTGSGYYLSTKETNLLEYISTLCGTNPVKIIPGNTTQF